MFYIDSSENLSEKIEDAISRWEFEADAQAEAVRLAGLNPSTIYYVRKSILTSVLVYQAEATLSLETKVIDPANES